MPHYKDKENKLHFLDSVEFTHLLPAGCVEISEWEAAAMSAPSAPTPREIVLSQILECEAQQTDRRIREAALGIDGGWLSNLNSQIAALREQLTSYNP